MTVTGGNLTGNGGGILNNATLTLRFVHVTGNTPALRRWHCNNGAALNVISSTVSNNTANLVAGVTGGGIDSCGALTVTNSTISGNRVLNGPSNGGGIWSDGSSATITNSTITDNEAAGANSAGGLFRFGGTVTVRNTIIAANRNNATTPDVGGNGGTFTSNSYNIIGHAPGGIGFTNGANNDQVGNSTTQLNPLVFPLGNYGSGVPTHALRRFPTASPAIDNGAATAGVTTDARGVTRPFDEAGVTPTTAGGDSSDIGAFEHLPYVNNNAGNALANSGAGSLRDTFAAVPAGMFVIFDPDFFGNSFFTTGGIARTISLSGGQILLNKNTFIVGTTANALTIRNTAAASTTSRVFFVNAGLIVELSGMTVTGGNPTGDGGGILNNGSTLSLRFVHVTGNIAGGFGGGIRTGGSLTITSSTVSKNTANFSGNAGGGIDSGGTVTVTNSTISGNRVPNGNLNGGGIWTNGGTITNSTIIDNEAAGASSAGGVFKSGGAITVRNTIVAANRNNSTTPDVAGTGLFTSQGYNLIGNVGAVTAFNQTGDQIGTGGAGNQINPLLAPLAANGGGATPTHALTFGSPALDKGNCFGCSLDQRLVTRPFDDPNLAPATSGDNSDIGAFELYPHVVTNTNDAGAGSLRQALLDSSDGHTIFFAAALNGQTITLTTGELLVDMSVHISGPGADQLAVSGNNARRVFYIASGTTVSISGLTIRNGLASGARGGGIYIDHANLTLNGSTLSGNSANVGGGICNDGDAGSATLTVTDSTINSNSAVGKAAVFTTAPKTPVMQRQRSLAAPLAATPLGSPEAASKPPRRRHPTGNATVTLTGCTVSGNTAQVVGGSIRSRTGSVIISNTILKAGASGANIFTAGGTVTSQGYNLSSDGAGGFLTATGDQINTDPKLGPLASNGGPTQTHRLLAGSPAIDKGKNLSASATDQRGFIRTVDLDDAAYPEAAGGDASDIGAFERQQPEADDDSYTTTEDTALVRDAASGVLANDTSGMLSAAVASGPIHASAFTLNADGSFSYTPAQDYNGPDQFTYTVSDGASSDTGTVSIIVTAVNDPPVANNRSITTNEDTATAITLTGSDVDGTTPTFSVVDQPANGALSGTAPNLTYTPNANYNGPDSFTFKVNDGSADSNVATVSITVTPVNDAPTVSAQSITIDEDTPTTVTLTGSDIDGDALSFGIVANPAHGTLSGTPPDLIYTPHPNYAGADSFTFKANDGQADSAPATVSITVNGLPEPLTLNISTRMRVETGDRALIAGTIITGSAAKKVIIRAIGPSLSNLGISDALANPVLELYGADGVLIRSNDNWKDTQQAEIEATGVQPNDDRESAIVATLMPGSYTAVLRGKDNTTGVAVAELYDLDTAADSRLANISTRGFVQTGDNVMIGGFILGGNSNIGSVIIRGLGPSLIDRGVADALVDPTLELRDSNGNLMRANDNWQEDAAQASAINASGVPPTNPLESAISATLPAGQYTAILAGKNNGTGIGLVEIYNLP